MARACWSAVQRCCHVPPPLRHISVPTYTPTHASIPAQGLTAIALESGTARRPRLAAAARSGKRSAAVVVYEVFRGAAALGPAARCVAQAELPEPLSVKARPQQAPLAGAVCPRTLYACLQR